MITQLRVRLLGIFQLLLASIGFGFLGVFGRWAFAANLSIGELLTFRFTLAALLLWIYFLLVDPKGIVIGFKQIGVSALLGVLGYAVFSTLYFTAVQGVSIAVAAMLLYTYPFWVSLFSHFLTKQKMTAPEWFLLGMGFSGLVLLLWGDFSIQSHWAIAAGLLSAITYAIYILASAKLQKNIKPLSSSLYVITFSALALFLFHRPHFQKVLSFDIKQGSIILGIALVCTILSLTLILAGLQKIKATTAATLTMIEPLTAALAAHFIFGESLTKLQLAGMALVLTALGAILTSQK